MLDRDKKWGWLFVMPWVIGMLVFSLIPIVCSLYYSFTEYTIINPPEFMGVKNYVEVLSSRDTYIALRNNIVFALLYLPVELLLSCALAVALNQKLKSISMFRGIFAFPAIAPMTAICAIWVMLYNPFGGMFNHILSFFGIGPFDYIFSNNWFTVLLAIAFMCVWKGVGMTSIPILAALQNISDDIYEAADIDGAGVFTKFFKITLPLLRRIIFFLLITGTISMFNSFEIFKLMAQETSAEISVIATYVYSAAFSANDVGRASSIGWCTFIIVAIFTYLQNKLEERWD